MKKTSKKSMYNYIVLEVYKVVKYNIHMATFTEIKEVRIRIADPANHINIIAVETLNDLPSSPAQQTAYYVESSEYYMGTDVVEGAQPSNYNQLDLRISDEYIEDLIDAYGVDRAVCNAYAMIISQLGNQLLLVKNSSGAESSEYSGIKDMLAYYRQVKKDCDDQYNKTELNSTGRLYKSEQPPIAGGNI